MRLAKPTADLDGFVELLTNPDREPDGAAMAL
jgi:hypothetical protein